MANLTSTLDIILKDDVSPRAAIVEAALKKMEAEAKQVDAALGKSGTSDKFAASLKKIGAGASHVEAVTKAWREYAAAEGLAASRGDWTAKQIAGVRNWESVNVASIRAVMSAEKALQAQQHARAEAQHREMERLAHQQAHGEAHHGFKNFALQSAAMAVSAHAIMHGIEGVLEHGAEYQHRLVALKNAGRSDAEIAEMTAASHSALRGVPTATLTGNLEILNETVGAFGSVEHALEHLPFMNRAAAVLHAVAGDKIGGGPGEMGNLLARFFEMRGTAGNGELFEHEASEMMKSMVFTGGNVNPRELLNFAQQAKSALQNYDLHFLSRVAPSLIGEVGGDRAGTQANAFTSVILGKVNDKKQAEAWQKFGLVDPKLMQMKAGHAVGWTGGAVYHTDEALKDPLEFGEKYVLPALQKHGINIEDRLELTKALGTMFRNQNANAFANELWQRQNRNRLHKDDGLIGQVEDPKAIYKRLLNTDPEFALTALKGSFGSFLTTLSSPLMEPAARGLSGLAENLNELAIASHNNPATAVTAGLTAAVGSLYAAGKLSYGLVNGFGATIGQGISAEIAASLGGVGGIVSKAVAGEVSAVASHGMKVGALAIAAEAGITLTAGTVAFLGLSAAAIIAGLSMQEGKHHRGNQGPFMPTGFDPNDPKLQEEDERKRRAARAVQPPPGRREAASQRDTDVPGHIVYGRGGARSWVRDEFAPMKNAPYFATAPLGPDGHPLGPLPFGMWDRIKPDPTTGTIIGFGHPVTDPRLYSDADMPLPPVRPGVRPIQDRTIGNYIDFARPEAAAGTMPAATPPPANPVPATPEVDTSRMHAAAAEATEVGAQIQAALSVSAAPQVSTAALDAVIAKAHEAREAIASIGSVGGATSTISARKGRSFQRTYYGNLDA